MSKPSRNNKNSDSSVNDWDSYLEGTQSQEDFTPDVALNFTRNKSSTQSGTSGLMDDEIDQILLNEQAQEDQALAKALNDIDADRFEVKSLLGQGATGAVYDVHDKTFDREVAVKFLHRHFADKEEYWRDFIREARLSAYLEHPSILPVHDFRRTNDGRAFFMMRKAQGTELQVLLKHARERRRLPPWLQGYRERINIIRPICDAVAYSHSLGIIHQDIKPANIMLGRYNEVLLLDWGTARELPSSGHLEKDLLGTPLFMAPEQARQEYADERSDVYALGATLFYFTYLRYPTWSADPHKFWAAKKEGIIKPPNDEESKDVPPGLEAIIMKCLEPEAEGRYQSAEDLQSDLRHFVDREGISVHNESPISKFKRIVRNNKRLTTITSIFSLLIISLIIILFEERNQSYSDWILIRTDNFNYENIDEFTKNWDIYAFATFNKGSLHKLDNEEAADFISFSDNSLNIQSTHSQKILNISYAHKLQGDILIEWDTHVDQSTDNARAHFNCFIGGKNRFESYHFHLGSSHNPDYFYVTKGTANATSDSFSSDYIIGENSVPGMLTKERTRYKLEKSGKAVRLYIDDQEVFEYFDFEILASPEHMSFGLENRRTDIKIRNLRINQKPIPRKVSPLLVADAIYNDGGYELASAYYENIIHAYQGTDMHAEALFKLALCQSHLGKSSDAELNLRKLIALFPDNILGPNAMARLASLADKDGDIELTDMWLEKLAVHPKSDEQFKKIVLNWISGQIIRRKGLGNTKRMAKETGLVERVNAAEAEIEKWKDVLGVNLTAVNYSTSTLNYVRIRSGDVRTLFDRPFDRNFYYPFLDAIILNGNPDGILKLNLTPDMQYLAYIGLGLFKEADAINLNPEKKTSMFTDALISQNNYQRLHELYPNDLSYEVLYRLNQNDTEFAKANFHKVSYQTKKNIHAALGQFNEIHQEGTDFKYRDKLRAMVADGYEHAVLEKDPSYGVGHNEALCSLAVKARMEGNNDRARMYENQMIDNPINVWTPDIFITSIDRYIYPFFMMYLDGKQDWEKRLKAKLSDPRLKQIHIVQKFGKILLGETIEDNRINSVSRWTNILHLVPMGMRAEIDNDVNLAIKLYKIQLDKTPPWEMDPMVSFIKWRIAELSK